MRLWIAHVPSMDTPFDESLCVNSSEVKSFTLEAEEGGQYVASVEVKNRGLAFLAPDMPRFAIISWSPTNSPTNGVPLARGYFDGVPTELSANFATIRIVCAPKNVAEKLKACAQAILPPARAGESPAQARDYYYDPLVVADKTDLTKAMVEARPHVWHVDPYTHVVTLSHLISGERWFDLGRRYDNSVEKPQLTTVDGEPPARRIKVKLIAEWTQQAEGFCEIGGRLNMSGPFSSLNPDALAVAGRNQPGAQIDYQAGAGWEKQKDLCWQRNVPVAGIPSGYVYEQKLQDYIAPIGGGPTQILQERHVNYPEIIAMQSLQWGWVYNWFKYSYTQPRREEATITLDYPIADIATAVDEVVLDDITTTDLLLPEGLSIWETGKAYAVGDLVLHGGKAYRCIKPHVSTLFWQQDLRQARYLGDGRLIYLPKVHPEWKGIPSPAAISDARQSTFLDTSRGQDLIAHVVHRAHTVGLQRSRYLRLSNLRFAWRDAIHIRLTDRVRVQLRGRDGTLQPVEGKVEKLRWEWQHRKAVVILALRIDCGDGTVKPAFTPQKPSYPGLPIGYLADAPENTVSRPEHDGYYVPEDDGTRPPEDPGIRWPEDTRLLTGYVPEDPRLGGGTGIGGGSNPTEKMAWWGTGEYPDDWTPPSVAPGPQPTSDEVAWMIEADRVVEPVDAYRLDNALYSVLLVDYQNPGTRQATEARALGQRGQDARLAVDENPTRVVVALRPLEQYDTLVRSFSVPAESLKGRRGVDLVTGGPP